MSAQHGRSTPLFPEGTAVQHVATGASFGDSPLWIKGENVVRWCDTAGNRLMQLDPATGETIVWKPSMNYPAGQAHHIDLGIVLASHGARGIEKAPLVPFMESELLMDAFEGSQLNGPHHLAVHPSDGTIWFTDPQIGLDTPGHGPGGETGYGRSYVFRLNHHGDLAVMVSELTRPHGIAFAPDGRTVYVSNSAGQASAEEGEGKASDAFSAITDAEGRSHVWAFTLDPDEGAEYAVVKGSGRVFAAPAEGTPAGLLTDGEGRVWVAGANGVRVFHDDGSEAGFVPTPEPATALCIGGPGGGDVFITTHTGLFRVRTTATALGA